MEKPVKELVNLNNSVLLNSNIFGEMWCDKKHISFCLNKWENIWLLDLMKFIEKGLINLYKRYEGESEDSQNVASFFYEKGEYFYIRCFLPKVKSEYNIISKFENEEYEKFSVPRIGYIYHSVIINFKNIWEDNSRAGFNIELKNVEIRR
jgi:hypothetical protein